MVTDCRISYLLRMVLGGNRAKSRKSNAKNDVAIFALNSTWRRYRAALVCMNSPARLLALPAIRASRLTPPSALRSPKQQSVDN
jgi:hypothetical protein